MVLLLRGVKKMVVPTCGYKICSKNESLMVKHASKESPSGTESNLSFFMLFFKNLLAIFRSNDDDSF